MTEPTKKQLAIGYLELTLSQCCVGINVVSCKYLIQHFPIFLLLTLRFGIGLIGMLGIALLRGISILNIYNNFISLSIKDKWLLFIQGLCGGFLFNIFILYGMKTTDATSAGIITSLTPIMIFILAAIFLKEKITTRKTTALFIALAGLIILNLGNGHNLANGDLLGNFLIFMAVIPEAFFTILSKSVGSKIRQIDAVVLVNLFNLLMFLPLLTFDLKIIPTINAPAIAYLIIFIYGITSGVMFFLFWYRGLTKINANIAALFTGIMPVSTALFAFLFLRESIQATDILGMFLVIAAIFVGCGATLKIKTRTNRLL